MIRARGIGLVRLRYRGPGPASVRLVNSRASSSKNPGSAAKQLEEDVGDMDMAPKHGRHMSKLDQLRAEGSVGRKGLWGKSGPMGVGKPRHAKNVPVRTGEKDHRRPLEGSTGAAAAADEGVDDDETDLTSSSGKHVQPKLATSLARPKRASLLKHDFPVEEGAAAQPSLADLRKVLSLNSVEPTNTIHPFRFKFRKESANDENELESCWAPKGLDLPRRKEKMLRRRVDSALDYGIGPFGSESPDRRARQRRRPAVQVGRTVELPPDGCSVAELARICSKTVKDVERNLRALGSKAARDSEIDTDTAELLCLEMGFRVKRLQRCDWDVQRKGPKIEKDASSSSQLPLRPPIVSVMGHVDAGKTTLLDTLRKADTALHEASGITQRLGAFVVPVEGRDTHVTFFDTPGHAAFRSMRHSAGKVTDVIVLVIAADAGVQAQTLEVLQLLQEQPRLQLVVALTKMDLPGVSTQAAREKVGRQLLERGVVTEGMGGDVPVVPVSGRTGEGLQILVESIVLQAEMMELHADADAPGEGIVMDSTVTRGSGAEAAVLVTWGCLKTRQHCVVGTQAGRIRALLDAGGKQMDCASVGVPVRVLGLQHPPKVGDELIIVENEERAKDIAEKRSRLAALREMGVDQLDESQSPRVGGKQEPGGVAPDEGELPVVRVPAVMKADGHGALAAMQEIVSTIPDDEVQLQVVQAGIGPVTTGDVEVAAAAGSSAVYAFNTGVQSNAVRLLARQRGVRISEHKVIYAFLDDVATELSRALPATESTEVGGRAQVLQVFPGTGKGGASVRVAGCRVVSGKLKQGRPFRVLRGDEIIYTAPSAESMRHFKQRVSEIEKGHEGGVALPGFDSWEEGDILENYEIVLQRKDILRPTL
jgi:translation initiation factor IF-2